MPNESNLIRASELLNRLDLEGAIAAVGRDYVLNPTDPGSYLNLGLILVNAKMPDHAIRVLNAGLECDPNHATILAYRGQAYTLLGQSDLAEKDYNDALSSNPSNLGALYGLGMLRIDQEAYDEADHLFTQLIEAHGGNPPVYVERAYARAKQGKIRDAIDDCTKALNIDPNFVAALSTRAELYKQIGETRKAALDNRKLRSLENAFQIIQHIQKR